MSEATASTTVPSNKEAVTTESASAPIASKAVAETEEAETDDEEDDEDAGPGLAFLIQDVRPPHAFARYGTILMNSRLFLELVGCRSIRRRRRRRTRRMRSTMIRRRRTRMNSFRMRRTKMKLLPSN